MTLFSYVVARDYGFAPNPYGGICSLATCKPQIRKFANVGDWIVGTGCVPRTGRIVYTMQVTEILTFNEYWYDNRFRNKKPNLRASKKYAFGDNIYHLEEGLWAQENSHHSYANGEPNKNNIDNDTKADRVLLSDRFVYWGGEGPEIPAHLRNCEGHDLCIGRGYKVHFPKKIEIDFVNWIETLGVKGCAGKPLDWDRTP